MEALCTLHWPGALVLVVLIVVIGWVLRGIL